MKLKNIGLIICLYFLSNTCLVALAEESLADVVRTRAENSKDLAKDDQSTKEIPQFLEANKNEFAHKLSSFSADDLKKEGGKLRDEHIENNPDGIMATMVESTDIKKITGDNCKGCEKYGELKMFTDGDRYMRDPIGQMDLINSQGCAVEEGNKGFVKQENIETYTDIIKELRICEKPITKFRCTRTLSLECKSIAQCDYGGIAKSTFSEGLIYEIEKGGALTIGTDGDNYYKGECSTFVKSANFKIAKLDLVSIFKLVHVKFDDYMELKLNGNIIYVGPDGGDYVRVEKEGDEEKVYNGKNYNKCERDTSWDSDKNMSRVSVDLKPYLKQGENTLEIKIIVSGGGEGWLKIDAKQKCCENNNWQETWIESCE